MKKRKVERDRRKLVNRLELTERPDLVETLYMRAAGPPAQMPRSLMYQFGARKRRQRLKSKYNKKKPTHYKIVCISLYHHDIQKLEEHVARLRHRGYTKANKSQVIRFAIDQVAIEQMPKVY